MIRMLMENEMGGACSTNWEEERICVNGGKAKKAESTRETNTWVGG
jgi:hypothetical protein